MLNTLISVPLTYNYLTENEFGLLATIVSIMTLLSFADMGVGFGLQNILPTLVASNKESDIKSYISTTWVVLLILSAISSVFFFIGINIYKSYFDVLDWNNNGGSIMTFFACFIVGVPFSIIQRIQVGLQEGHKMQIWSAVGTISALGVLIVMTNLKMSLPWIIFSLYGTPQIILIISFVYNFKVFFPLYVPNISKFKRSICKVILSTGVIFVISQLASSVLSSSSNIMIAGRMGANEVSDFSIVMRFATLLTTPIILILPAILPSINDAFARGDNSWIKKTYRNILYVILSFSTLLTILYIYLGKDILKFWIGSDVNYYQTSIVPILLYMFYLQVNAYVSYMMLSSFYIKFLVKIYPISVLFTLILKYFSFLYLGKNALIYTESLSMLSFFCIPSLILIHKNNHI